MSKQNPIKGYSRRTFIKQSASVLIGSELLRFPLLRESVQRLSERATRITLLHTSDIHGQLKVHDEFFWKDEKAIFKKRGGFACLKTMIKEFRRENPNTLVVDTGDLFHGSAVAALSEGKDLVPLINDLRYDVMLPGNWEVVYGKHRLISNLKACHASKVCTNMCHDTGELIFPPYQIYRVGGIKIGFVGYTDPMTSVRQSPAYSHGIKFIEPEKNLEEFIKLLKDQLHCELVVALTHLGMAKQIHLSNQPYAEGVDYIFGGDTHERIRQPIKGKYSKVTEPGAFGSFVGKLDLVIDKGQIKDETYQLVDVDPEKYKADERMLRLTSQAYQPYQKKIKKVIGRSTTPLYRYLIIETPMDNLITDALMWKAKPDIALSNGFRFCPPLVPDEKTGEAEITREYLWSMLPVNAEVMMAEATGQQLCDWLEQEIENVFAKDPNTHFGAWLIRFQGMKIKFTIGNEFGKRLKEVFIQGESLNRKKTYSILACEREGDPDSTLCRIKDVNDQRRLGYTLHEVIEEYLQVHSPVSPKIEDRAEATDAPATLLTQSVGVDYQFM